MIVKLDDIAVVDRGRKDMGDLLALAASIKANGQITPIAIRPRRDDDVDSEGKPLTEPWVLVAGGRRFAAHMLLQAPTIKAENLEQMTPLQHTIIELEENLARKPLEWVEEVELKERIHKARMEAASGGWSQKETAREIGESTANLSKDLQLAKAIKADPSLKDAPTKKSALRQLEFKQSIRERVANIQSVDLVNLRSKLVTADMRDFIRTLPENSIDLTFTDLPFGIEYAFDKHDSNKYADSAVRLKDLVVDMVPQWMRVTKPNGWIALMMGSTNYEFLKSTIEDCCSIHYEYRLYDERGRRNRCKLWTEGAEKCYFPICEDPEWIWFRPNSRNPSMHPERHAQNQYEKICVVNMGGGRLTITDRGNVLVHDAVYTDRIHEMQRPHSLCVDIIERLTLHGQKVADFCFGSASGLAAAADLGRDWTGCDINPNNLEPAMTLVSQYIKRGNG